MIYGGRTYEQRFIIFRRRAKKNNRKNGRPIKQNGSSTGIAYIRINRHGWSSDKYDSIITGIYSAVGGKNPIGLFGRSFSFGTDMSKRGEI